MSRQPLYPHVPKSKQKAIAAEGEGQAEKIANYDWDYVGTCIGSARSDLDSAVNTLKPYLVVKGVPELIEKLERIDAELNTLYERGSKGKQNG